MSAPSDAPAYLDSSLPFEQRAHDLVSRMTLEEKVSQMLHEAAAIARLGVPQYNWWNECLHGVGRAGLATVFPQAIGLAATWDVDLMGRVAAAISDEARAKHHEFVRQGIRDVCTGLTFWSPNINIFRDPRWGRGHETYGEDPHLTARLGVAFVKGLQGDHPRYLKLVATPKHYAVHSGPEPARHSFDARVGLHIMRDTYLPAFEACVKEGKAASVMGAYNRVNGEACCASKTLLKDILRDEWGFDGYVVSDCGAINDIFLWHRVAETAPEAAALAVKRGCDLNCGDTYRYLLGAVDKGLITGEEIAQAVERLFVARMRLGMFDAPEMVPYAQIPYSVVDSPQHRRLALEAAQESLVLLKNEGNLLPLRKGLRTIAVIGPYAMDSQSLRGNYNGTPAEEVTILEGIKRKAGRRTRVLYAPGTDVTGASTVDAEEAWIICRGADVAIVVLGSSPWLEGEESQPCELLGAGDRHSLDLPGKQEWLLQRVHATGIPVVLVLVNGSALAINWADENVPAILETWYPGQAGGLAVAEALFGDANPGGRLPVSFYKSLDQVPPFEDYSMAGHTYRYFRGEPLYPFGYGLSYTQFAYSDLKLSRTRLKAGQVLRLSVTVENTGSRPGDEVVQLYLRDVETSAPAPIRSLKGFQRVRHLGPGRRKTVRFTVEPRDMALVNDEGKHIIEPGLFELSVGGGQPGARGTQEGRNLLAGSFEVVGQALMVG
jgi:beta-glucosidase